MEQFSLEKYLENQNRKVITRDGREVDIYYSSTSKTPLIGRTSDNEIYQYTKDGFQCDTFNQAKNDLFFADEEEELTEFEKAISEFIQKLTFNGNVLPSKDIKGYAKSLLDLARKELQPEFDKEMDKMLAETDKVVYQKGQQDILKSLPKWKKANVFVSDEFGLATRNDDLIITCNGYQIKLSDLKALPKEE